MMTNREIANVFDMVADMLEIKGEIIHRVLSYRRTAETVAEYPREMKAVAAEGKLEDIPGVGKVLAEKIQEMLDTGKLEFHERLRAEIPEGVVQMLRVNGVGPKKAKMFWESAGITSLDALEEAAKAGKLRNLPGMGAKSETKIIEGIDSYRRRATDTRTPLGMALPLAEMILARLLALPGALRGTVAGSARRGRPTVGDLDLLVASENAQPLMDAFVTMPEVSRVLGHGESKSSVELANGLQVDLRVLAPERWGTALQYFSGSQAHNIKLRTLALAKGLSLNEHALNRLADNSEILCATEEQVYETIGLPWIPPELREDWGEIEAAQSGRLPSLISIEDIHADLHMHTTWSDGTRSIREMAEAAQRRGRKFIVITDHSRSATVANGLSVERLLAQQEEVRNVDAEMRAQSGFRVFHGSEVEIKADGTLDYPDDILAQLDFVVASLHVSLRQPREQVTQRALNAVSNPHVDLMGHPRGQLIPDREGADLDMELLFTTAAKHGTALEINSNPERLDLEAQYAKRAVELGVKLCIDTDAHSEEDMDLLRFGVLTARRGWVEARSVVNTWSLDEFLAWVTPRGK
ncbi:MAG: DNA polymerase/3'-5' exonuclease PolX [Chloroflexota bacterium]|nr:DNA polymerase/3'-5' exonuclease PolX [Chloroflexota bacterium]